MEMRMILKGVVLGLILSVFAGCVPTEEAGKETDKTTKPVLTVDVKGNLGLNFSPQRETNYKVVTESTKDYSFVQPSANKSKERHSSWQTEVIFGQKIDKVDSQKCAIADITIKKLKYLSQSPQGKTHDFDSTAENDKTSPLSSLIGQNYKVKLSPHGRVEVVDAAAVRQAVSGEGSEQKIAKNLLSKDEIIKRHQVLALNNAEKKPLEVGSKWSTLFSSPAGMLKPQTFEKTYTLTDIKKESRGDIATVVMEGVPSSKHIKGVSEKNSAMGPFANMFDEKAVYSGEMVLNLTTGEIENYQELLKVEWLAIEPSDGRRGEPDKTPDQLTMGFTYRYSIEKVNND